MIEEPTGVKFMPTIWKRTRQIVVSEVTTTGGVDLGVDAARGFKCRRMARRAAACGYSAAPPSRSSGSIVFVLRSTASTTVRCSSPLALAATAGITCRAFGML